MQRSGCSTFSQRHQEILGKQLPGLQFLHDFPGHFLSLLPAAAPLPRLCPETRDAPAWGGGGQGGPEGQTWAGRVLGPREAEGAGVGGIEWFPCPVLPPRQGFCKPRPLPQQAGDTGGENKEQASMGDAQQPVRQPWGPLAGPREPGSSDGPGVPTRTGTSQPVRGPGRGGSPTREPDR